MCHRFHISLFLGVVIYNLSLDLLRKTPGESSARFACLIKSAYEPTFRELINVNL